MNDLNLPYKSETNDLHQIHHKGNSDVLYTLNANIQHEDGNSLLIQNEHSNLLCSRFKPSYSVLHVQADIANNSHYFFLLNEETGCSEIGRITKQDEFIQNDIDKNCGCDSEKVLDEALETQEEFELCTYETIISDCCPGLEPKCLNFSKHNRISSTLKLEANHKYLYWVDGNNPDRRIDLNDLDKYKYKYECNKEPEFVCLNCEDLNMRKDVSKPCIFPEIIITGGNLKEGAYMATIAYSDEVGNEYTEYLSQTNWVMVNDINNKTYIPSELDRNSGLGIKFKIFNLDADKHKYYKVVILSDAEENNANGITSPFILGVFPTNNNEVNLYSTQQLDRVPKDFVFRGYPVYYNSKFITQANRTLFRGDITTQETINLQKICSLMGQFVKWRTVIANENLYEDGVFVSLYEQYMRDEVYPLAISFFTRRGYTTRLFPFVARALDKWKNRDEDEILDDSDKNYDSINKLAGDCEGVERNKLWQYYNTATKDEVELSECISEGLEVEQEERLISRTYYNEEVIEDEWTDIILDSDNGMQEGEVFTTFSDYIERRQNKYPKENFFTSTEPDPFDLRGLMNGATDDMTDVENLFNALECNGNAEINNDLTQLVVLDESGIEKSSVYTLEPAEDTLSSNIPSLANNSGSGCQSIQTEIEGEKTVRKGDSIQFSEMNASVYWKVVGYSCVDSGPFKNLIDPNTTDIEELEALEVAARFIGLRNDLGVKTTCYEAVTLGVSRDFDIRLNFIVPAYIKNASTLAIAEPLYKTTKNATPEIVSLNEVFTDKLHKNAIWYKYKHNPQVEAIDYAIIRIARNTKTNINDKLNYSNRMRITVYKKCSDDAIYQDDNGLQYSFLYYADKGISFILKDLDIDGEYFIAIDTPIVRTVTTCRNGYVGKVNSGSVHVIADNWGLSGTIDCAQIKAELPIITQERISVKGVKFQRISYYTKTCLVNKYGDLKCDPQPYEQGRFAYWESTEKYPCNNELWDSSDLKISQSKIPLSIRAEFEKVFTDGVDGSGNYILKEDATNFTNKNIRHFKFPDDRVSPHQDGDNMGFGGRNKIFPLGIWISNDVINAFLDIAVDSELITQEFRDEIVGYEIHRGDRRKNKSIIAKGLAFDMLEYEEQENDDKTWQIPNYPFNDLRKDALHDSSTDLKVRTVGNKWTFHSPNIHYERPGSSSMQEVKLEMLKWGETSGHFQSVKNYPKYIILSQQAFTTAELLAITEITLNTALDVAKILAQDNETFRVSIGFSGTSVNPAGIGFIVAARAAMIAAKAIAYPFEVGRLKSQWVKIFYENGSPQNFASMYVGLAKYQNYVDILNNRDDLTLRALASKFYLYQNRYQLTGVDYLDININNLDRESSLYINLGNDKTSPVKPPFTFDYKGLTQDDSRYISSEVGACQQDMSREIRNRFTYAPYLSIKNYVPNQYGAIDNVIWYQVMYCGKLLGDNKCDVIFGGDTYISRFSLKRKMRMYVGDALGGSSLVPFEHRGISNVRHTKYYLDYNNVMQDNFLFAPFPTIRSSYKFDCNTSSGNYVVNPSRFYLYYIGIVDFLVESEFNNNYRYAQNDKELNFYQNVSDYLEWCQPDVVRFSMDNAYYYNYKFSRDEQPMISGIRRILPATYNKKEDALNADFSNKVIYSDPDFQNRGIEDPYLIVRPNNQYDFEKKEGKMFGFRTIEDNKVLGLFENGFIVFNAETKIQGTTETFTVGDGGIFKNRPTRLFESDLGQAGTQHRAISSNPFGHFWVDAKRGTVNRLGLNASGFDEISMIEYNWFKENLPFKILKDFPNLPLEIMDNTVLGLGISIAYDARFKRVFFTKKDARVKTEFKNRITHNGKDFILDDETVVYPYNKDLFDDYSWTRAYYPEHKTWFGSFYSFKPDYYIEHLHFFQTGYADDNTLYSHLLTNRSYQVYRGALHSFKVEIALGMKFANKMLSHLEYWLDVRRYHNEQDWAELQRNVDTIIAYSNTENSGLLKLVNREPNNLFQDSQYPKYDNDGIQVLSTYTLNKWSVNFLYNHVRRMNNNVPIWNKTLPQDDKVLNHSTMDYRYTLKDRLKSDLFKILFEQYKESRLKYIFKFNNAQYRLTDN